MVNGLNLRETGTENDCPKQQAEDSEPQKTAGDLDFLFVVVAVVILRFFMSSLVSHFNVPLFVLRT